MTVAAGGRLGPYEIGAPLGSGGMGEVYRARDTRLGREVAIKVLPAERTADEGRRRRFVQEARAASALNHPHIVTIHEIETAEGVDFIVMELVHGKTLDALIPRHGMRLGEVLRIAIPLADALAAAHGAGIVHRDLKPANVMVMPEGVVKVLDFGLAKLRHVEVAGEDDTTLEAQARLSRPRTVTGTPAYMSPEQASGGKVDARSDIFSFGVVLYEMLTGRRPFGGGSTAEMLASLLKEQPKPPSEIVPDVPKDLERIILRCLRKEPARRFQHMVDVRVEIEEIKGESASGLTAPGVRAPGRRGLWVAAGLVTALAVAAGGLLLWRPGRPEPPAPSLVPLTSTAGSENVPTFSPDGDQIAFAWNGEKEDNSDIYIQMIGSSEARRLTTDPAFDFSPCLVPGRPANRIRALFRRNQGRHDSCDLAPRGSRPQGERPAGRRAAFVVAGQPVAGDRGADQLQADAERSARGHPTRRRLERRDPIGDGSDRTDVPLHACLLTGRTPSRLRVLLSRLHELPPRGLGARTGQHQGGRNRAPCDAGSRLAAGAGLDA